jgi:hypothetical protein
MLRRQSATSESCKVHPAQLQSMSYGDRHIWLEVDSTCGRALPTQDVVLITIISNKYVLKCSNVLFKQNVAFTKTIYALTIVKILRHGSLLVTAKFGQVRANNRTISKATCSSFFPS